MSAQHADPREAVVHLHQEHASLTKRRIVPGRLRRRRFGVSNTNHREQVMLHCQEAIVTPCSIRTPDRGGAAEGIVNTNQAQ